MSIRKRKNTYYIFKREGRIITRSLRTSDISTARRYHDIYQRIMRDAKFSDSLLSGIRIVIWNCNI